MVAGTAGGRTIRVDMHDVKASPSPLEERSIDEDVIQQLAVAAEIEGVPILG